MMYAPQPLFNTMATTFEVQQTAISLVVTVVLLPLAVAPLAYGFMLESISPRLVLISCMTLLALLQCGMAMAPGYASFMVLRCLQGLLVPAMLTALMTRIGTTKGTGNVQRIMALYIASTIFGAFAGRLGSGFLSTHFGWRTSLLVLAGVMGLCAFVLGRLSREATARFSRPSLAALPHILRLPGFFRSYLAVFCAFFVFASLLNLLPFRLAEIAGDISEFRIAAMYSGYLLGILVCIFVMPLVRFFGNERRAVLAGMLYFIAALFCLASADPFFAQCAMLFFPPGFFLVHAVMPGHLNSITTANTGLVNGCYLAIYYLGGALGSWLPGYIYRWWGWDAYIAFSCGILLLGMFFSLGMPMSRESKP